eukprot:g5283.t1
MSSGTTSLKKSLSSLMSETGRPGSAKHKPREQVAIVDLQGNAMRLQDGGGSAFNAGSGDFRPSSRQGQQALHGAYAAFNTGDTTVKTGVQQPAGGNSLRHQPGGNNLEAASNTGLLNQHYAHQQAMQHGGMGGRQTVGGGAGMGDTKMNRSWEAQKHNKLARSMSDQVPTQEQGGPQQPQPHAFPTFEPTLILLQGLHPFFKFDVEELTKKIMDNHPAGDTAQESICHNPSSEAAQAGRQFARGVFELRDFYNQQMEQQQMLLRQQQMMEVDRQQRQMRSQEWVPMDGGMGQSMNGLHQSMGQSSQTLSQSMSQSMGQITQPWFPVDQHGFVIG